MEMDLTMDMTCTASTNEVFSLVSPCSIFNNDGSGLISEAWDIAERKAEIQETTLETPDVFRDLGPDLGFDSWAATSSDLGISLDDPFFETFVSFGDGSPLDLFPDILPLSDTVPTEDVSGLDDVCDRQVENTLVSDLPDALGSLSSESASDSVKPGVIVKSETVFDCEMQAFNFSVTSDELSADFKLENEEVPALESGVDHTEHTVGDSVEMSNSVYVYSLEILDDSSTLKTLENHSVVGSVSVDANFDLAVLPNLDKVTLPEVEPQTVEHSFSTLVPSQENGIIEIIPDTPHLSLSSTCNSRKRFSDDACRSNEKAKIIKQEHITDKQTLRRIKNNIASRHSRASRRNRERELCETAEILEVENTELRKQVEELSKQTEMLRKVLIQKLSGC